MTTAAPALTRADHRVIAAMVPEGARVLDVGCGDGALLEHLVRGKGVDGRGIELAMARVTKAVSRGLAVVHGDGDADLMHYPDAAFDVVILSETLQAMRNPRAVLTNMLRIGRCGIVSFSNLGHWRHRWHLLAHGRVPMSREEAEAGSGWWNDPNIHACSIRDFMLMCRAEGWHIDAAQTLDHRGQERHLDPSGRLANLLAEKAVFRLSAGTSLGTA